MSQEPMYVSKDDSTLIVAGTANIQSREHDGVNDLNAFSVAAALGKLAKVSLERRVVLLAATRIRRAAEIMEEVSPESSASRDLKRSRSPAATPARTSRAASS